VQERRRGTSPQISLSGSLGARFLAIAPEAQIDKRGFDQKIKNARRRFKELEPATPEQTPDNKLAIMPVRRKGTA